jgi:hypothetical protein
VNARQQNNTAGGGTIKISGNVEDLTLRSIKRDLHSGETAQPIVQVITVSSTPAIGSLLIDDLVLTNSPNGVAINGFHLVNGTIENLTINNYNGIAALNGGPGQGNALFVASGTTVTEFHASNWHIKWFARSLAFDGTVTSAEVKGLNHYGPTAPSAESIRLRGTIPLLQLHNCNINLANGGSGTALGIINLNGSSGTTVIRGSGNNFNNAANVNLARAASEAVRWDGIDVPVPSTILTAAAGDVLRDSTASNAPVRCSTAPSTFTAL